MTAKKIRLSHGGTEMSIDTRIADENTWNLLQEQELEKPLLCPVTGYNAEMCGCPYGVHKPFTEMQQEIERLTTRLEDAESVIFKYAQETNWFSNQSFTDLDDPEKRLYQDVWNFDSEDGFDAAQTYLKAYKAMLGGVVAAGKITLEEAKECVDKT